MKTRSCLNCNEPFDRHDLVPFIFMRTGNTINCLHCQDLNYLTPNKKLSYWIVFCIAAAVALLVLSLVFDLLGFMGIRPGNIGIISGAVAVTFIIIGIVMSLFISRFILKLWNWQNGNLTLDDNKQSVWDFG